MPTIKYRVTLDEQERSLLNSIATRGKHNSQKVLNALLLLACDEGVFQDSKKTNQDIANVLPVSMKKIDRVKKALRRTGLGCRAGETKRQTPIPKKD